MAQLFPNSPLTAAVDSAWSAPLKTRTIAKATTSHLIIASLLHRANAGGWRRAIPDRLQSPLAGR
jgi:hypothetical protein